MIENTLKKFGCKFTQLFERIIIIISILLFELTAHVCRRSLWCDRISLVTTATDLPHKTKAKCQPVHQGTSASKLWSQVTSNTTLVEKKCKKSWKKTKLESILMHVWNEMIDMSNELRNTQRLDIFVFCHKPNQKQVLSYQNEDFATQIWSCYNHGQIPLRHLLLSQSSTHLRCLSPLPWPFLGIN